LVTFASAAASAPTNRRRVTRRGDGRVIRKSRRAGLVTDRAILTGRWGSLPARFCCPSMKKSS
jgi:hypothetical protein